jgi:hypothetical protein
MSSTEDPDRDEVTEAIVANAGRIFAEAARVALESGHSVVCAENAAVVEIFPDGARRWIKDLPPPTRVKKGAKITFA